MVQCKWCKTKTRTNYYLLKHNGKIIAHFCSDLCLRGWANRNYELRLPAKTKTQTTLHDHISDTSTEVIKK